MTFRVGLLTSIDLIPEDDLLISKKDYLALREAAEDRADERAARAGLESLARDGGIPAQVLYATLDGVHPVAAWRAYRDLTQAQLAERAGLTQAAVARIEGAAPGAGRPATRKALADALDAPLWSIEGR